MACGTVWRYGGAEWVLDLLDAGCVRRLEESLEGLRAAEALAGDACGADFIAGFCARTRAFFDGLFGEGAGVRLIGEADNARTALLCYQDFLDFGRQQGDAARALAEAALLRYAPERCDRDGDDHAQPAD